MRDACRRQTGLRSLKSRWRLGHESWLSLSGARARALSRGWGLQRQQSAPTRSYSLWPYQSSPPAFPLYTLYSHTRERAHALLFPPKFLSSARRPFIYTSFCAPTNRRLFCIHIIKGYNFGEHASCWFYFWKLLFFFYFAKLFVFFF